LPLTQSYKLFVSLSNLKPDIEITSHQFSARFKKGVDNSEEFEQLVAEFMAGFIQCYPHYVTKKEFDSDKEDYIFKFYIEKFR